MKIIDLLNKIAKGEEVPKKIKYQGDIYLYDEDDNVYNALEYCQTLLENVYECDLNDEIEIIEEVEDKEYEDIGELCYNTKQFENDVVKLEYENKTLQIGKVIVDLSTKIDALIRNQKYILEQLNK